MTRKKFIKNLMSAGISRNAANWGARHGEPSVRLLVHVMNQPGVCCITNVVQSKTDYIVKVKALAVKE